MSVVTLTEWEAKAKAVHPRCEPCECCGKCDCQYLSGWRDTVLALVADLRACHDILGEYAEMEETHAKRKQAKDGGSLIKSAARETLDKMQVKP